MSFLEDDRKIVFVVDANHGTSWHRLKAPMAAMILSGRKDIVMMEQFKDVLEGKVDLTKVKAFVFSRFAAAFYKDGQATKLIHPQFKKMCEKYNIKVVVDLDDRWYIDYTVDKDHATMYNSIHQVFIKQSVAIADIVWSASKYLLKRINKELKVPKEKLFYVPNGLDPIMDVWKPTPHPNGEEPVFGYIAAIGHQRDVNIVNGLFEGKKLLSIEYTEPVVWKVDGEEFQYHMVLGSDHKVVKPKKLENYGSLYDDINVSIAPLLDNDFTNCKSYLKAIEAGFKKRALIASNTRLYRDIIDDGKNGVLCRSRAEWKDAIDNMTVDRSIELGEALYEKVHEDYNIHKINKIRLQSMEND